jgi:hypothetical protein
MGWEFFLKSSMCTNNQFCNEGDMNCWPISSILLLKGWVHNAHYSKETLLPMSGPNYSHVKPNYLDGPIRYLFTCETHNYLDGHPPQAIKRVGLSWKHTLNCWSYSFLTANSSWCQRVNKVCICFATVVFAIECSKFIFWYGEEPHCPLCRFALMMVAGFCTRLDEEHAKSSTLWYQYFGDQVVNV